MAKLERSCVDVTRHETAHIHRGGSRGHLLDVRILLVG
jgi:hypothetical protein